MYVKYKENDTCVFNVCKRKKRKNKDFNTAANYANNLQEKKNPDES